MTNKNWKYELDKKGYFIIKNLFNEKFIDETKDKIKKDNVQTDMLNFVNIMMNGIGDKINTKLTFLKFRVSNNNNSVDAGGFHSDVIFLKKWFPVMTCLTYLDDTVMEIVETSHRFRNLSFIKASNLLKKTKQIKLKSGDIMVFYSTLLHRGIFAENKPNRRLVQVFDCFEKGHEFYDKIVSVSRKQNNNNSMLINKIHKFGLTSYIFNIFSYYNFISGTTAKEDVNFANKIGYSILSSEGLVKRWEYTPYIGIKQPLNVYIINPENKNKVNNLSEKMIDEWEWLFYKRQIVYYSLFMLFIIIILIYLIYKSIQIIKRSRFTVN
jgi:hypothetical protein